MAETIAKIIVQKREIIIDDLDLFDIQRVYGLRYEYVTHKKLVEALKKCKQVKDAWLEECQVGPFDYVQWTVIKYKSKQGINPLRKV